MLSGYKTYLVAGLTFLYAVIGIAMGFIDNATATQLIVTALIGAGLRSGISATQ